VRIAVGAWFGDIEGEEQDFAHEWDCGSVISIWTVAIERSRDHRRASLCPIVVRTDPLHSLLSPGALIEISSYFKKLMLAVNERNKTVLNFRFLGCFLDFINKETPPHDYHGAPLRWPRRAESPSFWSVLLLSETNKRD